MTWARIVPDQFQRAGIFAGDDLEPAGDDRIGQVAQFAIQRNRDGLLCKRLGNRFGDVTARRASSVTTDGTIGKCKGNCVRHRFLPYPVPPTNAGGEEHDAEKCRRFSDDIMLYFFVSRAPEARQIDARVIKRFCNGVKNGLLRRRSYPAGRARCSSCAACRRRGVSWSAPKAALKCSACRGNEPRGHH